MHRRMRWSGSRRRRQSRSGSKRRCRRRFGQQGLRRGRGRERGRRRRWGRDGGSGLLERRKEGVRIGRDRWDRDIWPGLGLGLGLGVGLGVGLGQLLSHSSHLGLGHPEHRHRGLSLRLRLGHGPLPCGLPRDGVVVVLGPRGGIGRRDPGLREGGKGTPVATLRRGRCRAAQSSLPPARVPAVAKRHGLIGRVVVWGGTRHSATARCEVRREACV